ncbi:MAG: hypothetical protein HOO96_01115 [Polyangiaceae bacterium]|nr:hypothetical protein [Polyangiaceae bacterium]
MALVSCSACRRHTRAESGACAFCGGELDAPTGTPNGHLASLSRAALLALAVSGCKGTPETIAQPYGAPPQPPVPQLDAGEVDAGLPMAAAYGAPPVEAKSDAGIPADMYGAPPPPPPPKPTTTSSTPKKKP